MTDADARGDTELHRAVYSDDDRKVAELCRSAGAGLDQPNLNGDTPLICAVQMHSSRCVEVLLKAHASVASRNCAGYSPLLIAASEGRTELVALLAQSVVRTDVALLDATVGLVTLEQNQIIKIFSVLGVIFLPPTLIASIYGMNFINMPELKWDFGFFFSLALMFGSVAVTFLFFRMKKLL